MTTAAICATREVSWRPSFYRGEQYDPDLGLYYLRARYYNPNTGRFVSMDPEDGIDTDPKTLHKYLYAGGEPVNHVDPTGRTETTANGWFGNASGEYAGLTLMIAVRNTVAVAAVGAAEVCSLNRDAELLQGLASDITQPVQAIEFGVCTAKVGKCRRCYPVEKGEWAYSMDISPCGGHYFKNPQKYDPPICLPPMDSPDNVAHFHLLQMNQTAFPECRCFWNRFKGSIGGGFPPGPPANLPEVEEPSGGGPEWFE
jgi:RHS repeat-associated protein